MSVRNFEAQYAAAVVDPTTGCRNWQGYLDRGYARYSGQGAYRVAYETFVGPVPPGMTVDHICFNPGCVEVAHLRLLDNLTNARNRRHIRRLVPHDECVNGHKYDAANTYRMPNGRRDCRPCIRARVAAYKSRKQVAS